MKKIGILTFHYSNNYGGVLQSLSVQKILESKGYNVEIINFVPSKYNPTAIFRNLGINRQILRNSKGDLNLWNIVRKVFIMKKYNKSITRKINNFRNDEMKLSKQVDESDLDTILNNYNVIIVGSDQVWNPSQRNRPEYFLDFGNKFKGTKISYAADSTIKEFKLEKKENLQRALNDFDYISVRNQHSFDFVESITGRQPTIVADPTIVNQNENMTISKIKEDYILTYVLGKDIEGTHEKALEKIKEKYGNLPVYSIKIPTMNFKMSNFADKVYYDLDPNEWIRMFQNAKFVYTDSFHGVLYSLKFKKPFLAYYTEKLRATRFIDLGKRYNIEKYIVQNTSDIDKKKSIEEEPNFLEIEKLLNSHKKYSLDYIDDVLSSRQNEF